MEGVKGFPDNFLINNLMEAYKADAKSKEPKCEVSRLRTYWRWQ
jgi:hypothetical protein